jgi:hypothetical protein
MEEMFQTALVVAFAAVLLIAGELFMKDRSTRGPFPSSATLSLPRRLSLDTN